MSHRTTPALLLSIVILVLLFPTTLFAQGVSPQAAIGGSIQQGAWYEQWERPGTSYCQNNRQRYITTTSEAFTLSAPYNEQMLAVSYNASRSNIGLARSSYGTYVYTGQNNAWVQLLEVTRLSPTQMSVYSTFFAKDGSCTLSNRATWSFAGAPPTPRPQPQTCTVYTASGTVNRRSGPGISYPIVGKLSPGSAATVITSAFDTLGIRWWLLADNTWVSGAFTVAQGNCPR